jgi:dihydrofolate reductase
MAMNKVIYTMSMSVDGFVVGPHATKEEPLGKNGEFLHEWAFRGSSENAAFMERSMSELGASICGRKTYDDSLPFWDEKGPTGDLALPLFVVTHRPLADTHKGGIYHAVHDGIVSAIAEAKVAAQGKDVGIMGANVGTQAIAAGLVDEITVNIVPVLFGNGVRMFEALGSEVRLDPVEAVGTTLATHVVYRVVR